MQKLITTILVLTGLVNFAPVIGLLSAEQLSSLYGIATLDGDLLILMRHRALLFGIFGSFMIYAAFRRHLQPAAVVMGLVSMLGYELLLFSSGGYGEKLYRVAVIDAVALLPLILAAVLLFRQAARN